MQSTTLLVNFHSSCPKCGASIDGDNKSCGSCGSVSRFKQSDFWLLILRSLAPFKSQRRKLLACSAE
ncbi:hypothetical protein EJ07DRAFT_92983 [Lizonia empirigonia]|nr:hypothetical protein EJ07DRAFT_92983 [Lizonia empirigonia]